MPSEVTVDIREEELIVGTQVVETKLCKFLSGLLHLVGIRISFSKQSKCCNFLRFLYLFALFLICAWTLACQIFEATKFTKKPKEINHNDHFTVLAIIYVAAFENQRIGEFINGLVSAFSTLPSSAIANKRYRHFTCIDWTIIVIYMLTLILNSLFWYNWRRLEYKISTSESYFSETYAETPGQKLAIYLLIEISSQFENLCKDIFWMFFTFICFLLKECFTRLNAIGHGDVIEFQTKHQEISMLVDSMNSIFSTATLVFIIVTTIELVTSVNVALNQLLERPNLFMYLAMVTYTSKTVIQLVTLAHLGQKIQSQAQRAINVLLQASTKSVSVSNIPNNEAFHDKNCNVTTLFAAHLATTPVVISASGLFAIDYNLITIVASIAITYHTLMPSLKSDTSMVDRDFTQGTATTLAPSNVSVNHSYVDYIEVNDSSLLLL